MRVAVTGGAGFIGQAVVRELERQGHEAEVVDRTHGIDICDIDSLLTSVSSVDAVIHLAGVLGTGELFDDPYRAIDVNVKGTVNVLKWAEAQDARYVGVTMPDCWDNVYQATKMASFRLANAWQRHRGLAVSHVRAFNVFGEGQHVIGVQKIVPTFATRAWRGQPLPIWGDGLQTVDLVYVDDVARMLVHALEFGDSEVFDAATKHDMTVLDVARLVAQCAGAPELVQHLPMRPGEHPVMMQAAGEGWDVLGWQPQFRYEDLKKTVDWYQPDRP